MADSGSQRWFKEVHDLMIRLESAVPAGESVEAQAAARLHGVLSAFRCDDKAGLAQAIARLHTFWLNGVPWCSDLSRSLERVLMQFEELD